MSVIVIVISSLLYILYILYYFCNSLSSISRKSFLSFFLPSIPIMLLLHFLVKYFSKIFLVFPFLLFPVIVFFRRKGKFSLPNLISFTTHIYSSLPYVYSISCNIPFVKQIIIFFCAIPKPQIFANPNFTSVT